jgi:hypothetical protein
MDNPTPGADDVQKQKGHFRKFAGIFIAILVLAIGSSIALRAYEFKRIEREADELAQAMERTERENYARAMADTYGGKTPQETLRLYIEAVEKGDYELASKYFIGDKQVEWQKRIKNLLAVDKRDQFLDPLRQALVSDGVYSMDKRKFFFNEPVSIDFQLYPNGIWKIVEI